MIAARLSKLTKRERTGLLIVAAIALVAAIHFLVWRPLAGAFARYDEEIEKLGSKVARNLKILTPASTNAVLSDYRKYGECIRKRASTAEENSGMLTEIESLASQSGVALAATKPREPRIEDYYEEYAVEIDVESTPKELVRFLYGLEQSTQLLRAQRLTLDAKAGGDAGRIKGGLMVTKVVTL
jgi:hypothetical protein